jgi:hypothetical protein
VFNMALQTANQFNLNPGFAQPISTGMQLGNQINHQFNVAPKIEQLSKLAASGDKQALAQLSGIAPDQATKLQKFQQTEAQGQREKLLFDTKSVIQGAAQAKAIADPKARLNFLKKRREEILSRNGDASHTEEAIALYESGDIKGGNELIDRVVDMGVQSGILKPQGAQKPAGVQEIEQLIAIAENPESTDLAKNSARRALGDMAKVGTLSTDERVANNPEIQKLITDYLANKAKETTEATEDVKTTEAGKRKAVSIAVDFAKDTNSKIGSLASLNSNYQSAIDQLDAGAETGVIYEMLPSFDKANQILDNIASQAGFDLAKSGGGIITEADMEWGMRTAIPQNLSPPALKEFLTKKMEAQNKIINHLKEVTTFLGDGTKTLSDLYNKEGTKKSGGVLMTDANGNKAIVYPDGTFEEQ